MFLSLLVELRYIANSLITYHRLLYYMDYVTGPEFNLTTTSDLGFVLNIKF